VEEYNRSHSNLFNELIEKVKKVVHSSFPLSQVDVYGSFASELCLPWSDIDIVIQAERHSQLEILSKIETAIKE
jgi:non-canonical poly(A) RNA polymerase PAPD5/7